MQKKICVMGLGYIGLPTSAMFATHGCKVLGVDINQKVVDALNRGEITIEEPHLDIMVHAAVKSGNLVADCKPQEADVFIIAVPTPITEDKKADMSYVMDATKAIVPYVKKGDIVILESTSPVGTVESLMVPILKESGLNIGTELYVGHSPERVLPGKILWELVNNNRVVGGINEESAQKIKDLYKIFVKAEIYTTTAPVAEMCKLVENTYRDVNIALANELAKICEEVGTNAWEVIKLANKHPRVNIHQPGPGVGGHCLAVDPWFIVEKAPQIAKIISMSRETNDSMPHHVLQKIKEILCGMKGKKRVTILGLTYKPNIDDMRESPVIKLLELLSQLNDFEISVYDPYVTNNKYQAQSLIDAAKNSDLIVLAVNHDIFKKLPLTDIANIMRNKNIFDTRNFLIRKEVEDKGFQYFLLGDGAQYRGSISEVAAAKQ